MESCGESSIPVFIVVVPKFSSFSESVILKAESVILKAVDCIHLNCKDFSDLHQSDVTVQIGSSL